MSNEEIVELIQRGANVSENMDALYTSNKNFIMSIAKKYSGLAEMDDLMQEGYIGLHTAASRYKPESGTAFLTYAGYWIKQRITRFLENNGMIRVPTYQYQRIQQYNNLQNTFMSTYGRKPTQDEICRFLNLSGKQIENLEKDVHACKINSLDSPVSDDAKELSLSDYLTSEDPTVQLLERMELEEMKRTLWDAVDSLEENQSKILRYRYQEGMTIAQAGQRIGVTENHTKAYEVKALRCLGAKKEIKQVGRDYGYIYSTAYKYGISRFFSDWTSSTEYVALKNLERQGYL